MTVEKTKKPYVTLICIMLGLFKDTADDDNQLHAKTKKIFLQLLLLALINIFWQTFIYFYWLLNLKKSIKKKDRLKIDF